MRDRYSLIAGKVTCAEMNDACIENVNLVELPAITQTPSFRTTGSDIICSGEEIASLFLPSGSLEYLFQTMYIVTLRHLTNNN